ncbi:hypothetical protein HOV56_gp08 [Nitrosopumilus spindle-shaped virus]|uniref:Uncharacterized protein n=1 Tax=Nitrosopumilus spindle-shaped virus TaxID=2508184 RepID=A0A514K2N9_9VIRU|nr:hypothetical protein HOV56_gp08 [Nitrosopumilus spindle-shaped virus]YP_010772838.1 hypothetical protein QIT54_gp08 [Nitrosopumilus spindle-shaped virus]QDI73897.1 hypothetical protein [Nitrosopumilus spindle-shaped virus]QDI73946.1 hypothetical protein [Nitrosopumilus spindle-shaped virus]
MSSFNIDSKGVLVDALKLDNEMFQLTNLILPGKNSLKAVYELEAIRADMIEFAKNSEVGIEMLGAPPKKPDTTKMSNEEAERAEYEYMEMEKMYEQQKLALTMHVPFSDMMMINNYLAKFIKTLHATAAVKGNRFYAFTKQISDTEQGILEQFKKGN